MFSEICDVLVGFDLLAGSSLPRHRLMSAGNKDSDMGYWKDGRGSNADLYQYK